MDMCRRYLKDGVQNVRLSEDSRGKICFCSIEELPAAPCSPHQRRKYADAQLKPQLHHFYYKPAKLFPHFDYFYNLTRKCIERIEGMEKSEGQSKLLSKDVVIKIGIAGWFSKNNLELISERTGKEKKPEDIQSWQASPLLCFQNQSSLKSALEVLRRSSACHRILIKSDEIYDDTKEEDVNIIIIEQNKEQIKKSITSCLEEPLHRMLEKWLEYLKNYGSSRIASGSISEIEAIREQMAFDESKMAVAQYSALPRICAKSIVPEDVKNYLFGRSDVNSFGIWNNSSLKIFVQKKTNVKQLKDELLEINPTFFEKYHLEIEERKLIETRTLRQGDSILPNLPNENGTYNAGTLGGFVTKTDDERKIYALTCNHLFLDKNEANLAYADNSDSFTEIGTCVFSTTDKSCDFAAIEIMDSFSDNCEVIFRREDEKKTNARLHTESLHPRIVHKIGAATNVTTGIIRSPEWYKKMQNDENREYIFLVEGIDEQFSDEGDSGALVFSRPKSMQQNYVDVLGMVYANDLIVYDDEDDQKSEKLEYSRSPYEGVEKKEVDSIEKSKLNIPPVSHNNENEAAQNIQEGKNISCCYRLYTALELFQENQGEDFTVKFKDDVSSSSRSSSPSSKSDESNQEPLE